MARREHPLDSADSALARFATQLRQLRDKAGGPTYRELSRSAHYSAAALSEAAGGRKLPSLAVTLAYATACGGSADEWRTRWLDLADSQRATIPAQSSDNGETEAPYRGPEPFEPSEAELFFGRAAAVSGLLARLGERRLLGLSGASGSGKSSLLRAGLVARARRDGAAPAVLVTPGAHPVEELAVHLAAQTGGSATQLRAEFAASADALHLRARLAMPHPPAADLLIVVDQFEEVFTRCSDAGERARFIRLLVTAVQAPASRARVVLGVRSDFHGHCARHPGLAGALRNGWVALEPLTGDELGEVITGPAIARGCMVESALTHRLIADALGQPAALALVSMALLETWRRRRGAALTLAGYEAGGGIHQVLARSAEGFYRELDTGRRERVRQILLRLISPDEAGDSARWVHRRNLDPAESIVDPVVAALARARLITLDRDYASLAHPGLIGGWPRLREWLDADRAGRRVHHQLADATAGWESLHQDSGALYRGVRLALAQEWAAGHAHLLNAREKAFLVASVAADRQGGRRWTRRLRQLVR